MGKAPRTTFAVLSLGFLLAGCSAGARDSAPEVATLQSANATAPATTAAQIAPVIRPDTTADEQARMGQPWMRCLKANGVPMKTNPDGLLDIDAGGTTKATNGRLIATQDPKVVAACGKLMPVLAPELDEDKNPYWADDNNDYNKCLVEHGDPLVEQNGKWVPGPGWDDWPPDPDMELACQAKAFDGKKG
jgi:hypothetical protein